MIRVTLEIDNHTTHSCSPLKFLQRFILHDATRVSSIGEREAVLSNPYAKITVKRMEQI